MRKSRLWKNSQFLLLVWVIRLVLAITLIIPGKTPEDKLLSLIVVLVVLGAVELGCVELLESTYLKRMVVLSTFGTVAVGGILTLVGAEPIFVILALGFSYFALSTVMVHAGVLINHYFSREEEITKKAASMETSFSPKEK